MRSVECVCLMYANIALIDCWPRSENSSEMITRKGERWWKEVENAVGVLGMAWGPGTPLGGAMIKLRCQDDVRVRIRGQQATPPQGE